MKNINKLILLISFIILVLACSALSMTSVHKDYMFTWVAMNPWNGVEGIVFTISHLLHVSGTISWIIASALLLIIWWRLYALLNHTFG